MEFTAVEIKKEKEDLSFENEGLQNVHIVNVYVKIENFALPSDVDWCIENEELFERIDSQFHERKDEKPHVCQICGQLFIDSHSLYKHNLQHMKVMIGKITIYQCDICLVCYTHKSKLTDHILQRHTEAREHLIYTVTSGLPITKSKHECKICHKVLSYKSWHGHMKEVHSDSPVQCFKCGKIFKSRTTYRKHNMYVHDGVSPSWRGKSKPTKKGDNLPCDECEKSFANEILLNVHKRDSHSAKKYNCYICKSVLKCRTYLLTHMRRVHYYDGKEHRCEICGKKFKSPRYVKVHIKNTHLRAKKNISKHAVKS